jgi:hypothetical protein
MCFCVKRGGGLLHFLEDRVDVVGQGGVGEVLLGQFAEIGEFLLEELGPFFLFARQFAQNRLVALGQILRPLVGQGAAFFEDALLVGDEVLHFIQPIGAPWLRRWREVDWNFCRRRRG